MSHAPPALFVALTELVPELHAHCAEPWCLIGSAAALMLGAEVSVADVDVLVSRAAADALTTLWADRRETTHVPADGDRCRSRFARYRFPGLPVEVMGGLEVFGADGWQPLHIRETVHAVLAGLRVPMPSVAEQLRVLACFGRPKDHQRAALLRTLYAQAPPADAATIL